ncbi:MAG: hypothetical protein DRH57_08220 [Candidatus Cloacimonadota bacterium]|nr:MAG: hypothetical protein DRH57_08220 [Candidatus Cloacimonadota bacterium]
MEAILGILSKQIKVSNPSFTIQSFRRTIEIAILKAEGLFFMDTVSDERIEEVMLAIPQEWEIEKRIRDSIGSTGSTKEDVKESIRKYSIQSNVGYRRYWRDKRKVVADENKDEESNKLYEEANKLYEEAVNILKKEQL